MKELFINSLKLIYGLVGIIGVLAYLPTIKDLYFNKKLNINIFSYFIWSFTTFIMFLYGLFILEDTLFLIITGSSHILCVIILFLGLNLQQKLKKEYVTINKKNN